MTFDEYKAILEKSGPLDGYAHGLLAAFELGYGQGLVDGKKHQEQLEQREPSAGGIIFAVEEAVRNGDCPFQIEQAFEEYEADRIAAHGIK